MACPYFYPAVRLEEDLWAVPPRLPLIDAYSGECRAAGQTPDAAALHALCNSGYARGKCVHFPEDASHDAVRFSVLSDSAGAIRVEYVFERNCWPLGHGVLSYSAVTHSFASSPLDEVAGRQAEVFIESYLRRAR